MTRIIRVAGLLLLGLVGVTVCGCGETSKAAPKLPPTVPVSGIVKMNGEPLAGAVVTFIPTTDAGFHGAQGRTDAAGKYELTTDTGDGKSAKGAIPGKYLVTVSLMVKPDGKPLEADFKGPPMSVGAHESLDLRYSSAGQTELAYDVPAGGGEYPIEITK